MTRRSIEGARIAVLSVHTSPLAQPGTGDAGGMNVYIRQTARRLAARGAEVEIFTRATSSADEPVVQAEPGVLVRNVVAGPFEGLDKQDLPSQLCAFTAAVLRAEATRPLGYYDLIHSHYWLSGQVGWLARDRWGVPLVHTAHTLAAVKNASLAAGDTPEPAARQAGEQQVVDEADRLIVNTPSEAHDLISLHGARPDRIDVVTPGVDLDAYRPGYADAVRRECGFAPDDFVIAFVGRIQPLKAPDVLLRAAAPLIRANSAVRVVFVGGPSGTGLATPNVLIDLAAQLGISDAVTFVPPQPAARLADIYRAANVVAVPSYSESFGLVAVEAQACGTPVIAADVGGLSVAVDDGVTGTLVGGHNPDDWTAALAAMMGDRERLTEMGHSAQHHAQQFSWENTADMLQDSYLRALDSFERASSTADTTVAESARRRAGRFARRWSRRGYGVRR